MSFTLGIDYGTNSVRALFVDVSDGRELAACVIDYPSGKQGILFDPRDANLARQRMASGSFICSMRRRVAATIGAADQISIRVLSKSCLPPDTALTVASAARAKAAISSTLMLK
jgi:ribulose kinase